MENYLVNALSNFKIEGKLVSVEPYGFGHINRTFLAIYEINGESKRFVLQQINSKLFNPVENLMSNIELVTEFNRKRIIEKGGDPDRESLTIIPTIDGKTFYKDEEDNYFRVYIFIEKTVAYQTVANPKDFYYSAIAFGNFNNLLAEFDASKLYEILPKGIDKGVALKKLSEIMNIDRKRTIAIGDYNNDIGMLRFAGLGVAVSNAREEVKEAADYITVSNEESAIAAIITDIDSGRIKI